MARTRDPRPSSDPEERLYPVKTNGHATHRVYEENEMNAAEALIGINASPTASHTNEPASASTSASTPPPFIIAQKEEHTSEVSRSHRHGNTARASVKSQKRNRGKSASAVATSEKAVVDQGKVVIKSAQGNGVHEELISDDQCDQSQRLHSGPLAPASQVQPCPPQQDRQTRDEGNYIDNNEDTLTTLSTSKRKRKRGSSVSVAAISRTHVEDTKNLSGANAEGNGTDGLLGLPSQTQSEPQSPTPLTTMQLPEQQPKSYVGGPANPEAEAAVNGTNTRKSKPKNFDSVAFGRWLIKTWYYSPYPISNVDDDNMSASTGATSGARGQLAKRGSTRGRPRTENTHDHAVPVEETMLWVCDKCFKYMQEGSMLELHSRFCTRMNPPGRKVYERGAHVIYEIDGAKDKLYCQCLSLFGKLFIDIKTLFYDCENFMFYVLTEGDRLQDHVIGFFSKEKVSYDDYNLACIITFPPYQRKRYGMLMIEFSYELSRRAGKLGTPERPLSELGLRTYLTYWTGALVQFFRRVLSVQISSDISRGHQRPVADDLVRFIEAREANGARKKRKAGKAFGDDRAKNRIWESGLENEYKTRDVVAATSGANDVLYTRMRWTRTSANPDGSATTHVFVRCTLEDISNATGIRTEDVAFTLHECGLLQRIQALDKDETEEVIVVSREMVEKIAREFNVKSKMCMEVQYCQF